MDFETICDISFPIQNVFFFGVPAWLIFYPPRRVRELSSWYRPVLAILTAQAGNYALFYAFVYPATDAYLRAHERAHPDENLFLDGILLYEPQYLWLSITTYTIICFVARGIYLACTSRTPHAPIPPNSRNA